jgi:DNA modification methylase
VTELGDCRDIMRRWIADGVRVQTCVTSPPYWGLRDYGVAGQLGLEATPEEYVSNMVEVFRLVRDVLADDGTLWLNLGDAYATNGTSVAIIEAREDAKPRAERYKREGRSTGQHGGWESRASYAKGTAVNGLKPKDLIGMPWRVAFALQADGWYLRSDIIWAKPNPMPESVTDRPTKAHEYLFLLAKRERYFYDCDAIREMTGNEMSSEEYSRRTAPGMTWPSGGIMKYAGAHKHDGGHSHPNGRNRRTVWEIATQPYAEAHFATFPEALVEPCILAGSRSGDIVLDPFMGSGTVARVATSLGRRYLGCELNPDYMALADVRSKVTMGLSL